MSTYVQPHLDRVVPLWMKAEDKLFTRLQMDREEFLNRFEETRQQFLNDDEQWKQFVRAIASVTIAAVRNMEWVNAFAWILPNADPNNSEQHRKIGRVMAALFYIELLSKHGGTTGSKGNRYLRMVDARWRIANQEEGAVSSKI